MDDILEALVLLLKSDASFKETRPRMFEGKPKSGRILRSADETHPVIFKAKVQALSVLGVKTADVIFLSSPWIAPLDARISPLKR